MRALRFVGVLWRPSTTERAHPAKVTTPPGQAMRLYSLDGPPGVITFTAAPGDGVVVTADYKFSAFTDAEAQALLDEYGLQKAVIEALGVILANVARLRNYKQGDTEVDNSQVFKQVKQLRDMYQAEYQADQGAEASTITVSRRRDPRGDRVPERRHGD